MHIVWQMICFPLIIIGLLPFVLLLFSHSWFKNSERCSGSYAPIKFWLILFPSVSAVGYLLQAYFIIPNIIYFMEAYIIGYILKFVLPIIIEKSQY